MENEYELYHHGILGMKWGVRRYQNEDGTLTAEGQKRYGSVENMKRSMAKQKKINKEIGKNAAIAVAVGAASALAIPAAVAVTLGKPYVESKIQSGVHSWAEDIREKRNQTTVDAANWLSSQNVTSWLDDTMFSEL